MLIVPETDKVPLCRTVACRFCRIDIGMKDTACKGYTISCGETICGLRTRDCATRRSCANCSARNRDVIFLGFAIRSICAVDRPRNRRAINLDTISYGFTTARRKAAIGIDCCSAVQGNNVVLHRSAAYRRTAIDIGQCPTADRDAVILNGSRTGSMGTIAAIGFRNRGITTNCSKISLHVACTRRVAGVEVRDGRLTACGNTVALIIAQSADRAVIPRIRNCTAVGVRQCPCYR